MNMLETIDHIKKHEDRDKVIELLEEALKAISEEYHILAPKIKSTEKELYIDLLDEQISVVDYCVSKMMEKLENLDKYKENIRENIQI